LFLIGLTFTLLLPTAGYVIGSMPMLSYKCTQDKAFLQQKLMFGLDGIKTIFSRL